jgi:hypothetical protein
MKITYQDHENSLRGILFEIKSGDISGLKPKENYQKRLEFILEKYSL